MAKGRLSSPKVSRSGMKKPKTIRKSETKRTVKKNAISKSLARGANRTRRRPSSSKHISTPKKSPSIDSLRQKAVRRAWRQERKLVEAGGGTRHWTKRQREQIIKNGRAKNFEGHHIRSVNGHSKKWTGDPRNIKFVTKREHLREHKGNFRNKTTGKLVDRQKMLRLQKNRASSRRAKK